MIPAYSFGYTPPQVEIVERKGRGHPDTLADGVAEAISCAYSRYCLAEFGDVLHHNCDKVVLLGGRAEVRFGYGRLTSPIRLVLNGRFSTSFGGVPVPWQDIAEHAARNYLALALPGINPRRDVVIHDMVSAAPSPGVLTDADPDLPSRSSVFMFAPRDRNDLTQSTFLESNDTSVGAGYAPYNTAHLVALDLERWLTSDETATQHPYLGRDVKIMAIYDGPDLRVTACVPFVADHTPDLAFYTGGIEWLREQMAHRALATVPHGVGVGVDLNTRDVPERNEVYLTATGSAIESGDEGVVGRGNRLNGVIHFTGPMSLEAPHGKNPIYHIGKIYSVLADVIACEITTATGRASTVHLISQSGRDLRDPWLCAVALAGEPHEQARAHVDRIVEKRLAEVELLSDEIIHGAIPGLR
ncbi:MAG: methionine adenosyltransferase [Pseudonocardiaceae bacterium]